MRDANSPKLKFAAKIFHVHSFIILSCFFMWRFKTLIGCFSSNYFDELERVLFFEHTIKQKCFQFYWIHYQIYLTQQI